MIPETTHATDRIRQLEQERDELRAQRAAIFVRAERADAELATTQAALLREARAHREEAEAERDEARAQLAAERNGQRALEGVIEGVARRRNAFDPSGSPVS